MTTALDLTEYTDKKVVLTVNLDEPNEQGDTAIELECKVESGNEFGLLVKPKGRTNLELIEASKIEDIRLAPEPDRKLTAKTLKLVEQGTVKQHLLDRHGLTLQQANDITDEAAWDIHSGLDHKGVGLGHVHGEKPAKERAAALEEKAAAAEGDEDNEDESVA